MIELGIQHLMQDPKWLAGARLGLIANSASYALWQSQYLHTLELLRYARLDLRRLFAPEHGFDGLLPAGEKLADGAHKQTGLDLISLYGERLAPEPRHLEDIDVLIFDLQDVGVRCYTYLSTLKECFEACQETRTGFLVLERPNPLGRKVLGDGVKNGYTSFVSAFDIPFMHGKTYAELAADMASASQSQVEVKLELAKMTGWTGELWPETGLPWYKPSPNLARFSSVMCYPATVFLEGTNVSEGRGTEHPFELIGAPWIDAEALLEALPTMPGVKLEKREFRPLSSKYQGENCQGIFIEVTDFWLFNPITFTFSLLQALVGQHGTRLEFLVTKSGRYFIDLLYGSDRLRQFVVANR